jgi:hypothetical protein
MSSNDDSTRIGVVVAALAASVTVARGAVSNEVATMLLQEAMTVDAPLVD